MNNTVRKGEMARRLSEYMGCTTADGEKALNAVLESITEAMEAGDRVVLTGFGTFESRKVKARKVRAIGGASSGELIEVPPHTRVGFRPGKVLAQMAREQGMDGS